MEGNEHLAETYDGSMQYTAPLNEAPRFSRARLAFINPQAPSSIQFEEGTTMSGPTREEIDAKLATSEARTDTKLAVLQGQFERVVDRLDSIKSDIAGQKSQAATDKSTILVTIVTTVLAVGFALAGLVVAVLTYGDAIFSRGMSVRDVVHATVEELAAKPQSPQK